MLKEGNLFIANKSYSFDDFLENAHPNHTAFFTDINNLLTSNGYEPKVDLKKTGFFVSYIKKGSKRSLLNYGTRKKGTYIRIYGDNTVKYMDLFKSIPSSMVDEILKAKDCPRLIDKSACNPRCKMGITIDIDGDILGKCRNSALMFFIDSEKYQSIKSLIQNEINAEQ